MAAVGSYLNETPNKQVKLVRLPLTWTTKSRVPRVFGCHLLKSLAVKIKTMKTFSIILFVIFTILNSYLSYELIVSGKNETMLHAHTNIGMWFPLILLAFNAFTLIIVSVLVFKFNKKGIENYFYWVGGLSSCVYLYSAAINS